MAQEAVNSVVQAFQRSMDLVQRRKEAETAAEERKAEREERKKEFEDSQAQQQKQFEARQNLEQATLALHQANQGVQNQVAGQQMGRIYTERGALPPGASATPIPQQLQIPGAEGVSGPFLNIPGQTIPSTMTQAPRDITQDTANINWGIPGMQPSIVRTPEAQRAITNQEDIAKQNDMLSRMAAFARLQHQDTLEILGKQEAFQQGQQTRQINAARDLANSKGSLQLQIQGLKNSGKLSGNWGMTVGTDDEGNPTFTPTDPTDQIKGAVDQGREGTLSLEKAKKLYNAKQWPDVVKAADQAGVSFLTDKQIENMRTAERIAPLVKSLYDIQQLKQNNWLQLATGSSLSPAVNEYKRLSDEIGGQLPGVSKWLNNIPRFTNLEMQKVQGMLLPSKDLMRSSSGEFDKYTKFTQELQDSFNTALSDIPEGQRNIIRQKLGFNNFPYLGSAIKTPGAPVGSIAGATTPSTVQGGSGTTQPAAIRSNIPGNPKAGQVFVIQKSTGKPGWVDQKEADMVDSKGNRFFDYAKPPWMK